MSENWKLHHPILTPAENSLFIRQMIIDFSAEERHNLDVGWTGPAEAGIEDYL